MTTIEKLNSYENHIDMTHAQILKKFQSLTGKKIPVTQVKGINVATGKWEKLPPDEFVTSKHKLHSLIRGVFPRRGSGYAQAIQLKPDSKWGLEIDEKSETLKIDYDFGKTGSHKGDIEQLEMCWKKEIPFGILWNPPSGDILCLGLGKIVNRTENSFTIVSFDQKREKSEELQEMIIKDYELYHTDKQIDAIKPISTKTLISKFKSNEERFALDKTTAQTLDKTPLTVNSILKNLKSGEWSIPDFQRYYKWDKDGVREFLDSIFHCYYVGSILLWKTNGREDLESIPPTGLDISNKDLKKNFLILDGQQRVTSLNYAINPPEDPSKLKKEDNFPGYFYINFGDFLHNKKYDDVIIASDTKISNRISVEKQLFPFYMFENFEEWITLFQTKLEEEVPDVEGKEGMRQVNSIITAVRKRLDLMYDRFEIPQIVLPETDDIEHVATIFEKINTTGIALGTFDLLIVRLRTKGVRLRDLWDKTLADKPKIQYYATDKINKIKKLNLYIMESISLCHTKSKSCKKRDILNLFHNNEFTVKAFNEKWYDMTGYVEEALELLEDKDAQGFGVKGKELLPYDPMIPILASLLREIHTKFENSNSRCVKKLQEWYWTSIFSQQYSVSVQSKKTADFKDMIDWFEDDSKKPSFIEDFQKNPNINLRTESASWGAIYRGILCLLRKNGAEDMVKAMNIGGKKLHKDHIFPKSKFGSKNGTNVNTILNMTWLTGDTNIKKNDKMPKDFVTETIKSKYNGNEKKFLEIISAHMIDHRGLEHMKNNDFEKFISMREELMLNKIIEVTGAQKTVLPTMTSTKSAYMNERLIRTKVEKCVGFLYWVDRYFKKKDMDIIDDGTESGNVKTVGILLGRDDDPTKMEKMKDDFKTWQKHMKENKNIDCQMKVMNQEAWDGSHDRFVLSKNFSFWTTSGDTARRKQVGYIGEFFDEPPEEFESWWENSYNILTQWEHWKKDQ